MMLRALIHVTLAIALLAIAACGDSGGGSGNNDAPVGSAENPQVVTVGMPLEGSVEGGGSYFTVFTTGNAGDYDIDLTGNNLSWSLYDNANFTAAIGISREAAVTDCPGGSCTAAGLGSASAYYLKIVNTGTTAENFTLTVETGLNRGTVSDPVVFNNVADLGLGGAGPATLEATVGTGNSYYVLNLESSSTWCVIITGANNDWNADLDDDLDLFAYTDATFGTDDSVPTNAANTSYEEVCLTGTTSVGYLRVDGSKSAAGASFFFYPYID